MADYAIHDTTLEAIADTIRKKEGSSALIDPADYPKRINLMGLLEEKSASGSIVTFSDGADEVPIKSWEVTLPASLDGYSSVDVVHCGKNILNGEDAVKTANNIRFYYTNGKYYHAGTYTLSISESVSGIYVRNVSTSANISVKYNTNFITFTLTEQTLIGFDFYKVGINQDDNVMLEVGSTATTYEPYTAPTVSTVNLGRTIYGGTADVVKGNCEPTNWLDDTLANLEQGSINGSTGVNENANNRVRNASAIPFPYDEIVSSYTWTIPSGYKVAIRPYDANGNFVQLPSWALAFITQLPQDLIGQGIAQMRFVLAKTDNSAITPSDMAEVGYILNKGNTAEAYSPYFEPFTFSPIDINSRLGANTMWSDGDMSVTYRASGTITPVVPTLISKTITANDTYSAEDDDADGYSEVVVNVPSQEVNVTPLSSNRVYLYPDGISGTNVERTAQTLTATGTGKYVFASDTATRTNTSSNDGFVGVKKNGTFIVKQNLNTDVKVAYTIPDIDVVVGDEVSIVVGFVNYHTSCEFEIYTAIAFVEEVTS